MDVTTPRPAAGALDAFHPVVAAWFSDTFAAPTGAQALAWPHIKAGRSTLVAAPTGSGKTLTAFLSALDDLVRDALAHDGALPDETLVVYVSPLKALSNDIHVNLEAPLAGIAAEIARRGLPVPQIRTAVRTGDTTQAERVAHRKHAPHILVTTPESLYVLLSSESGRRMLANTRTVIVDEIHALANNKRGSHLALSLERLDALVGRKPPRIGLSATQKPVEAVARFLVGGRDDAPLDCAIVDTGHARTRDLALELPPVPLGPVMANDVWERLYDRIAELAAAHRTTLVFVNTRRMAERAARHLADRLGADAIAAHHGSLAKEHRFDAEQRLKHGKLKLLVATASLELGIDIGDVDLVCQLGSPRGIAPFLQRVGRSGHRVGGVPKGRLFPLSRDELVECAALLDCVRRGELDRLRIPHAPLDVLAQQLVAEVACREWDEDALYRCMTQAAPYAALSREQFDDVLKMLAEGFTSRRGARAAYLHRDVVAHAVRGRRGARLAAVTSGGTIPDNADYAVLLEPQGVNIGTVNEDFAVESLAGDVFQLGNQSYRIVRVETGRVRVEDAHGQAPNIPFWLGEAPARSDELSAGVARLRAHVDALLARGDARGDARGADDGADVVDVDAQNVGAAVAIGRVSRTGDDARHARPNAPSASRVTASARRDAPLARADTPASLTRTRPRAETGSPPPGKAAATGACAAPPADARTPPARDGEAAPFAQDGRPVAAADTTGHDASLGRDAAPRPAPAAASLPAAASAETAPSETAPEPRRLAPVLAWLTGELGLDAEAARQIADYLARARAALGALPTQDTLVMERFFDESGGMQLVIHSPFGSRINRAWGLALRKRFCRTFNFELQAAATDDALILSLSLAHSFALDEVWRYLRSASAEHVLIQALLDAPLFNARWRWNATTSLALPRFAGGRKVAPQLQRMKSDDLLATVFPDQVACAENIVREREVPKHPLVDQTLDDCLHEAMDTDGWLALLRRIESGGVALVARDLPAPSPLAAEILNAKPYAFLDDAPLEERRTQAVLARRWTDPEAADDLGALDAGAIDAVRDEAWPLVRDDDEMHDALVGLACVSDGEIDANDGWRACAERLAARKRAARLALADGRGLWLPAERVACMRALYGGDAALEPPPGFDAPWAPDAALVDVIRARLTGFGPLTADALAAPLALPASSVAIALAALEREGYAMRGRFTPGARDDEWCERHLLARIHRYTVKRLRREIEPVELADFMRFLFHWQRVAPDTRGMGVDALASVVHQLEGFEAAASAWEDELLPARLADYVTGGLDEPCRAGKLTWARLGAPAKAASVPVKTTPVVLLPRRELAVWQALRDPAAQPALSARAERVRATLAAYGAMFFDELVAHARLLPVELERTLGELVAAGLVNADSFAGLRALIKPAAQRSAHRSSRARRGGALIGGMDDAGRWALVQRLPLTRADFGDDEDALEDVENGGGIGVARRLDDPDAVALGDARVARAMRAAPPPSGRHAIAPAALEHVARTLLRRYGVVFWRILACEAEWMPSWRELLPVYRRLEARGEIRGGRFVAGLAGEQFALPDAIPILRELRRRPAEGLMLCVSGADPLNLTGTLLPGDRVPALAGNRILFRDGVPIASLVGGQFVYARELDAAEQDDARARLARHR
ncbi:DEAD/DEAH box helicase [Burkholderia oklahomensis]|uniref:DEAD/DEAH box helicase n=2 Tax=Burkholderia oklahomensis TaxID=342113 RepID=UPI0005D73BAE|nr:DEAD/DEAH box helicase [Burkholderia oklahomensis]AJX35633.1 DEAD/DEAH box helicase family protein [Burkholderia oklahomensis C6786]AOI48831.1 ATP-dependent DNA helicase [Burkholderia oklahomensis C6786]KUY50567.1 ATP-dependent DNA helicase [Burkholderia oklahomensis C6786]MBI0362973.1 DEAD/DEAH box helicase [Burkholderia oklahomensis]SUY27075.1 ATP-dependent helicase [Burkholderia oklahomensis]